MQRLWFVNTSWVVLISVLVALLAAAACGGDDKPAVGAVDTEALSALVQEAVKAASSDAVSAEALQALVDEAVTKATKASGETLTASEVSEIVTAALAEQAAAADKSKGKVRLVQTIFPGGFIENYIVEKILTEEMGYEVETIEMTGLAYWVALCNDDVDVKVETYTVSRPDLVQEFITEKKCMELIGKNGEVARQSWYVPTYVIEGDAARGIEASAPDLVSWEQLRQYKDLFAAVQTAPKGRLVVMNIAWGQNEERMAGLGLDDVYEIQAAGSESALLAELDAAVKKGEPILVYGYEPHFMTRKWDLTRVELPAWFEGCELTTFACAAPADELTVAASSTLKDRLPEVYQFFQNFNNFTNEDMAQMLTDYDSGASYAEAGQRWMDRNQAKWQAWIP